MPVWQWVLIGVAASAVIYAGFVLLLVKVGRRDEARALARLIPDCAVLFRRLLADARVPRSRKALLIGAIGYLALPLDLVPDFIPVAGQADDAIVVALVLRAVLRAAGPDLVREHWPGPEESMNAILRLAYGSARPERA
jgi:uncharacterized membrane protein YkvA (DUF1232 family)